MADSKQPVIHMPPLCQTHRVLLVRQARYGPTDPWLALEVATTMVLFQGATCDPKIHEELGGDITNMPKLGCLACRKPDLFGEIVEVAKTHDLGAIKRLGEKWIAESQAKEGPTA